MPVKRYTNISGRLAIVFTLACANISFLCNAQTRKDEDIDIRYQKCIDDDTSCAHVSGCAFEAYKQWERRMTETYERLARELKTVEEVSQLRVTQEAWITLRINTFALYDRMYGMPGDKWCRMRHDARIDLVRQRALQLMMYYEDLKRK